MGQYFTICRDFQSPQFGYTLHYLTEELLNVTAVNTGTWQSMDVSSSPLHATHELYNVTHQIRIPSGLSRDALAAELHADLPWAENHFRERVNGEPINPGVEWENWPYHSGQKNLHRRNTAGEPDKFDHNYMERYWPKEAGLAQGDDGYPLAHSGIRFAYGDLGDVVNQLVQSPGTRQAYLPVFFPEDTGAVDGQRVPCSLGYHFMMRDDTLLVQYNLRSCDIFRHFRNDIYMTLRLAQWVNGHAQLWTKQIMLTTNIANLHLFVGDVHRQREVLTHVPHI